MLYPKKYHCQFKRRGALSTWTRGGCAASQWVSSIRPRQTLTPSCCRGGKKPTGSRFTFPPPAPLPVTPPHPPEENIDPRLFISTVLLSLANAHRSRRDLQRRPRARRRRRPPFFLSPADPSGGSGLRSGRLPPGSIAAAVAAATDTTPRPPRPQIIPGLRERARLLESGVLPHQGRVLDEGRLPTQLLLTRAPAAAATTTVVAVAAGGAVKLEGVRGRWRQRWLRQQPRRPLALGPGRRRVGGGVRGRAMRAAGCAR